MFWSEMADYTVFSVFLGAPLLRREQSLFDALQPPCHVYIGDSVPHTRTKHLDRVTSAVCTARCFAGLLYLRMGTSLPMDLSDRVSGLWFSLAIIMFTPSFTALVVWDKERLLLRRESATGACYCSRCSGAASEAAGVRSCAMS